ncbi:MAG TPA: M67 family metallopeptidase [Ferrovibrio sp.]|uniref:M67 family metallopeptidase n=1 Tax=Ferrovibrio sp. TaxID=1917215 RepID=UPI002B4B1F31|nr:M67 family metallopeptidase [Ferrovibrio sp.]HLT76284.1 M67 family metallopeptidase [Ferrovibrio sp.]
MTLVLTSAQAAHLVRLAEAAYPREACALLVGRETEARRVVSEIVEGANVAAAPEQEFEFDPATHIALLRRLRESGGDERLIAHFHSHPDGRAEPSAKDAAMANDPSLLWLISAVEKGRAGLPRAFRFTPDHGFAPFPLDIVRQDS